MSGAWHKAGSRASLAEGRPLEARIGGKDVCVHSSGGRLYAFDDECPHSFAPLSSGTVAGETVTCPLHQAVFHLGTGKCLEGALGGDPDEIGDLKTYEVKVEGDDVLVLV
jgi:3-phenylpropionate/trans-cinnamate dioxygenase ferredoxin subunit